MPKVMETPPHSTIDAVTEVLHGIAITDPYRWLEKQESPETRAWICTQTQYARSYLDALPDRDRIRERIRDLLDVETFDSLQKIGNTYFFRKRVAGQEQPCIFLREGPDGEDQLLIDPIDRGTGMHTSVRPLRVSSNLRLLLYEVKQGGERTGQFEILEIPSRKRLPDFLPRGYLRAFAFAPDSRSFYYIHEPAGMTVPYSRIAYRHVIGTSFTDDQQTFCAGEAAALRLQFVEGNGVLGFLVYRFLDQTLTDFYLLPLDINEASVPVIQNALYKFAPILLKDGRILALTNLDAPNFRVVEVFPHKQQKPEFVDLIPANESRIQSWIVAQNAIYVSYIRENQTRIDIFDLHGEWLSQLPNENSGTIRLTSGSVDEAELFFERESFTHPIQIYRYSFPEPEPTLWAKRLAPFESPLFSDTQVWFTAKDGTRIPMFLVGRNEILQGGPHPIIMTAYGGYGASMTPQFSVFVAFLIEHGCVFALPNIRGGSEFGVEWHNAAKRRNRQVAFDDFLCAAEWLIATRQTEPKKLAIFGGSNSGLLVGAAMTQRPDLFRAVLCMVPMLDMFRYHLFDSAHLWKEEFGTSDDPEDFAALANYSPYHRVQDGMAYPATMIVSGDLDQNCNPLHARKMTARLQAANVSERPIFLDYSRYRGHSPVLPLSIRIESLTDRLGFLCDQLGLPA